MQTDNSLFWSWPDWCLKIHAGRWTVSGRNDEVLLAFDQLIPLLPHTGSGRPSLRIVSSSHLGESIVRLTAELDGVPEFSQLEIELVRKDDHLELRSSFTARQAGALHRWEIVPPGTRLNLYHALNIRNRNYSPCVVTRYDLFGSSVGGDPGEGGTIKASRITTASTDWQFAPHPSFLVLEKNELQLFLGAKDIPPGFGMVLEAENYEAKQWIIDYGQGIFTFQAGEKVSSPVFYLNVERGKDYWAAIDHWVDVLIAEKYIPDPATRVFPASALKPYLGPWIDQCFLSSEKGKAGMVWNWTGGSDGRRQKPEDICNEAFIRAEVERAIEHEIPFGWIGIDDRWFDFRGDFEVDRKRFPDLRGLIDWIHDKGWKVLLWWPPFNLDPEAKMNSKREWLAGGGAKNRHGLSFLDYSNPVVQQQWLLPKLRFWLGDEDDCLNADGFKLDFMADKMHPHLPVHDREWLGEERFIWQWHRLVYAEMKRIKPESILLGAVPHPHFASFQDWVRTYDVHTSDYRCHGTRGLRIRHLTPGVLLSYDFHCFRERLEEFLEQALEDRAHIEIGSLFGLDVEIGEPELALIRRYLERSSPLPGLRHSPSPALESKLRQWSLS